MANDIYKINGVKLMHINTITIDKANNYYEYKTTAPKSLSNIPVLLDQFTSHLKNIFGNAFKAHYVNQRPGYDGATEFFYEIKDNAGELHTTATMLAHDTDYKDKVPLAFLNAVDEIYDKQDEIETEPEFQDGQRTNLHKEENKLYTNTLEYDGKKYDLCSGKINFSNLQKYQALASMGTRREVILLDPESEEMKGFYKEFSNTLSKDVTLDNLFKAAITFSNKKIPNAKYESSDFPKPTDLNIGGSCLKKPVVSMQDIIKGKNGVCRHHGLFTAFLLGQYFKENPQEEASIHHCRSALSEDRAHTWVVCKQKGKLYIIDSMWNRSFDLSNSEGYLNACRHYGVTVIDKTLDRANLFSPDISSETWTNELKKELEKQGKANSQLIKEYIDKGADINAASSKGWTAAHVATNKAMSKDEAVNKNGNDLLDFVINKGANLNLQTTTSGSSPIFQAKRLVRHQHTILG